MKFKIKKIIKLVIVSILLFNLFSIASFFVYEYIANSNVYDDLPELYCDDLAEMRLLVVAPHPRISL